MSWCASVHVCVHVHIIQSVDLSEIPEGLQSIRAVCVSSWVSVRSLPFLFLWATLHCLFLVARARRCTRRVANHGGAVDARELRTNSVRLTLIASSFSQARSLALPVSSASRRCISLFFTLCEALFVVFGCFCNVRPYSFLCGPVSLSPRVACHQGRDTHLGPGPTPRVCSCILVLCHLARPLRKARPGTTRVGCGCYSFWCGELTVGDEFWARHGENGVTSDASLAALVACKDRVCKDRVCGPEFRCLPQAPPLSVAEAHALLLNSVAHCAERLESDALVLFGRNLGIPSWAEATYGKLLEHPVHAQPSQVVVVVTTDLGFDGRKDRDGILQEAVLHSEG